MNAEETEAALMSELMIMPDGRIYAHNLTPVMASVLSELNPDDPTIRQRALTHVGEETKKLLPPHWDAEKTESGNAKPEPFGPISQGGLPQ